jgi:peptidoglycan/xylan/chitin deacetylase (PgdA/CDA1 family)
MLAIVAACLMVVVTAASSTATPTARRGPLLASRPGTDAPAKHVVPPEVRTVGRAKGTGPAGSLRTTGNRGVALTFDDGPDPVQTPRLLNLLKRHHAKATFCVIGVRARRYPDLIRRIVAGGHALCNHSWDHDLRLGRKSPARIRADLARTNVAIRKAVPDARIAYFRAPGGSFTSPMASVAARLGMRSLYWHVDPRDWDHSGDKSEGAHRARVVKTVEGRVRRGSIVLSHDSGQPQTISAYGTLLPWLKGRYQLVALS